LLKFGDNFSWEDLPRQCKHAKALACFDEVKQITSSWQGVDGVSQRRTLQQSEMWMMVQHLGYLGFNCGCTERAEECI